MAAKGRTITDHEEIREWAEARGGRPAAVQRTSRGSEPGIIRLEFPGAPGAKDQALEEISWDEWFEKLDDNKLALIVQDETARGEQSNFNKLVKRTGAGRVGGGRSTTRAKRSGTGRRATSGRVEKPRQRAAAKGGRASAQTRRRASKKRTAGR